ncbi:MAG: TIGR03087 family PEP-CTERM/XrtA system glycosyltransferase [Gammaproteobacteria bacterium]
MKILFVCHRFPFPPKRGGKIRPFNIISHLTRSGHEVTVASLARTDEEAREGAGLAEHCKAFLVETVGSVGAWVRMILRLPTPGPSSMGYFYSSALRSRIDALLKEETFDLIFVHCSSVAQYVAHVRGTPKIIDFGDMDSQKWLAYSSFKPFPLSIGYWLEGQKMARAETRLAAQFDLCTATTKAELETLQTICASGKTGWFPNGVDRTYFCPDDTEYDSNAICFVGRMDYYPNQQAMFDFCANVWPLLKAQRPATTLTIVGAEPSNAVQELANIDGVTVTGSVPDVRPYLRASALTVAPLAIARGTQNKILESLALGVPVICSTIAAGGVDVQVDDQLLVADTKEQWSAQIQAVLDDPDLRQRLSAAGRERMSTHHDWPTSMQRVDALLDKAQELAG